MKKTVKEGTPCLRCGSTRKHGIKVQRCADCNRKWNRKSAEHSDERKLMIGYPCSICTTAMTNPVYDHNEATGRFRGWLCNHCNLVLGHVFDSINILKAATKYLEDRT